MYEKVKSLAERMASKDKSLRIAFNEADASRAPEPEAQEFLKLNESRLGRDFKLYAFMGKVSSDQSAMVSVLEEVVLPLQASAPAAYAEGLKFMEEQAPMFGPQANDWKKLVQGFKR